MKPETLDRLKKAVREFESLGVQIERETNEIHASGDHIVAIHHFRDVRDAMDIVKKGRELLELLKDRLSGEIVPELLGAKRIKTINIDGVGRVTISAKFSASIIDHPVMGKDLGHDWLTANGAASLVKPTVNASSLAAHAKSMMETEFKELPPEIFKVGTRPYTSITKAK